MEGCIKIYPNNLNNEQYEFINMINIDELKEKYNNALPFSYVIIDNFVKEEYVEKLYNEYPKITSEWHKYDNPLEVKYAYDNISQMPNSYKNFFYYLNSDNFINRLKEITNIPNLEYDPYLHGAGIHAMPNNGRLHMHLDYEKHPYSGKERRLNLIYFLNKEWDINWGGNLELWDNELLSTSINNKILEDIPNKKVHIEPIYNRAVFFKTNDISWHGIPEIIKCPDDKIRKSIACYWISDLNSNKIYYRPKARYIKRPWESDELNHLYKIRENRRLTELDFINIKY
jgi:Rps23 Pro-64 3,4-dihydroxylase Tpa1-like proline 4-hydroxylase